ncbi:RlpA-like double-psi beta-barrel-protein domain-containing protein-containing protein [Mycena maculata]|uniref:RlpA-like double-psi beta-barrel-protein domain-containing protein-containing protein n=1 Tax=Mycena maculata TaxID=230809 RepID=A0AAD7KEA6_9AGAR|nr:RlpA-like double-psi beta-barrel-protein domain-containing protein-containing protein [Mycena maculata]
MLLSLSFLSLLSLPAVYASQHIPIHHPHPKRATSYDANTGPDIFTLYDAGLGACGITNTDNDYIVAINVPQWDNGNNCFKEIEITYNGMTARAQITDECENCPEGGLDLSRGLFNYFADTSVGTIHGDWSFVGSATTTSSSTTSTEKATTTTTSTTHTSTTTSTSSTQKTSTSTTSSSSSSSPSSISTSSATGTSTSSAIASQTSASSEVDGNMALFSNAFVELAELVMQAVPAA